MYGVIKRVSAALLVSFFFSSLVTFFLLDVQMRAYFLRGMKTKWRSGNHNAAHIRLNTELVKKPKDLIEYVVVHEMVHLIEPTHSNDSSRFCIKTIRRGGRHPQSCINCRSLLKFGGSKVSIMSAPHASGPCVGPHVSSASEEVSGSI